jgi:hypothetical protein
MLALQGITMDATASNSLSALRLWSTVWNQTVKRVVQRSFKQAV